MMLSVALALQLGLAYQTSVHPMRAASATLSIIEARTGYLSALVIWNSAGPTVFEVRAGREPMNVNIRPGTVFPITGSGVGAVFAAFLPAADIKPLLQKERGDDLAAGIGWRMTAEEFGARKTDARTCGFVAVAGQPIGGVNSMLGNEGSMDIACGGALYDDVRAIMRDRTADLR
jgi:DNA-binding IclR family transcriptional regulator